MIPKYLKWDRHKVLQCALILGSAIKNFVSVAIATVKNFAVSISNSGVQFRTVIDFHFRFLGIINLALNVVYFSIEIPVYFSSKINS
jgi:hypothetical protein